MSRRGALSVHNLRDKRGSHKKRGRDVSIEVMETTVITDQHGLVDIEDETVSGIDHDHRVALQLERAMLTHDSNASDEKVDFDVWKFFTAQGVTPALLRREGPSIERALENVIARMESGNDDWAKHKRSKSSELNKIEEDAPPAAAPVVYDETLLDSVDIRSYQQAILNRAIERNTIAHLGTGTGKTFIALRLISAMASSFAQGKQTMFLVPSVALAFQQEAVLRANLPYTIGLVQGTSVYSKQKLDVIATCNVIVSTHGACQTLLESHAFKVERWNLLILDECHNCTGKSSYAKIMGIYYAETPPDQRPRVLGLTASPLINVKPNHTNQQVEQNLCEFEKLMDSEILSLENLGLADDDTDLQLARQTASHSHIVYQATPFNDFDERLRLDDKSSAKNFHLHPFRFDELKAFQSLYQEAGPLPVKLYASQILHQIKQNTFESETNAQFAQAKEYVRQLLSFCDHRLETTPEHWASEKLLALEKLLHDEIENDATRSISGVVFVQQRITAMALDVYFRNRTRVLECGQQWPPGAERRMSTPSPVSVYSQNEVDDLEEVAVECQETVNGNLKIDDQFGDADECELFATIPDKDHPTSVRTNMEECESFDQFGDADSCDDPFFSIAGPSTSHSVNQEATVQGAMNVGSPSNPLCQIQCGSLVRNRTGIFKANRRPCDEEAQKEFESNKRFRRVLNDFRFGKLNLLIATAVVEEGVDVQSCSFVVIYDSFTTLKNYIQMKGRARARGSKLFVFRTHDDSSTVLSLNDAVDVERKVINVLRTRVPNDAGSNARTGALDPGTYNIEESEIEVARSGVYRTSGGELRRGSAKSRLFTFAQQQPMEDRVRSSREALRAYIPVYDFDNTVLQLPAFFGSSTGRTIHLPESCASLPKKDKQGTLALLACVRLHKHGLLADNMLPLTRENIREKIRNVAMSMSRTHDVPTQEVNSSSILNGSDGRFALFQYTIELNGEPFNAFRTSIAPFPRKLAIFSVRPLNGLPCYHHRHKEMDFLKCPLGAELTTPLSEEQICQLSSFFAVLINGRWKRRTLHTEFCANDFVETSAAYTVGCLNESGEIDWDFMSSIVQESKRSKEERRNAVDTASNTVDLPEPRLWVKKMDVFVAYGPATGDAAHETSPHYRCHRLWDLPNKYHQGSLLEKHPTKELLLSPTDVRPKEIFSEYSPIANAALALETVILPQFLFHLERFLSAKTFIEFCLSRFPVLGECLESAELDDVIGLLTAKSTNEIKTYERLEWLGDAVLKLIQTDATLQSCSLKSWVSHLHEGYLDSVRSSMCCNASLSLICKRTRLDQFIRTASLERGHWSPVALALTEADGTKVEKKPPSEKVLADVIEGILGFAFLRDNGYEVASKVAEELGVTLPRDEAGPMIVQGTNDDAFVDKLVVATTRHTGYATFTNPKLLLEAFTHATELSPETSSYQRLEWIGDAVLCLAIRRWIYESYPTAEPGEMSMLEEPLVSNETLAFLCLRYELHPLLRHKDQTLPARFACYAEEVVDTGRGIWSSCDCPKPMADLVESILGSIHCDGGFDAGQKAAHRMMGPVLTLCQRAGKQHIRRHPKHHLLELGGGFISLSAQDSAPSHEQSIRDVRVCCLGVNLCRASDRNTASAEKQASALVLAVLDANPQLAQQFTAALSKK